MASWHQCCGIQQLFAINSGFIFWKEKPVELRIPAIKTAWLCKAESGTNV